MDNITDLLNWDLAASELSLLGLVDDIIPKFEGNDTGTAKKPCFSIFWWADDEDDDDEKPSEFSGTFFKLKPDFNLVLQDIESLMKESAYFRGMLGGILGGSQDGPILVDCGTNPICARALAVIIAYTGNPFLIHDIIAPIAEDGSEGMKLFLVLLLVGDYFQFGQFCKELVKHTERILKLLSKEGMVTSAMKIYHGCTEGSLWQVILRILPKVMEKVNIQGLDSILEIAGEGLLKANTLKDLSMTHFYAADDEGPVVIPRKVWNKMIEPSLIVADAVFKTHLDTKFAGLRSSNFFSTKFAKKASSLTSQLNKPFHFNLATAFTTVNKPKVEALLAAESKKRLLRDAKLNDSTIT